MPARPPLVSRSSLLNNANGLLPIERKPLGKIDLFTTGDLSTTLASRHTRIETRRFHRCYTALLVSGRICLSRGNLRGVRGSCYPPRHREYLQGSRDNSSWTLMKKSYR